MTVDNHGPGKEDEPRGGLSRRDFVTLSVVAGIAVATGSGPVSVTTIREEPMQYLVQMKLGSTSRPTTPQDGVALIEQFILPTLDLCRKLEEEKKILAGGPISGAVALVLIVNAESARELDDLITSLPLWSRMETEVIPLTSFEGRRQAVRPTVERLKARLQATQGAH